MKKKTMKPDWPANKPVMTAIHKIHPYPNNPRTHPPAQVAMLAEIMRRRGVDQPIVVDEEFVILKGHGRRLAALAADFAEYPVVMHRGLSDVDKAAMRIEDNQVALLAGWDVELIRGEIAELKMAGYDVNLLGFGEAQLVQFETVPGPPANGFQQFGEDIATEFECPRCKYRWSGSSAVGKENSDDTMRMQVREKANGKRQSRKASKIHSGTHLAGASTTGKNKT